MYPANFIDASDFADLSMSNPPGRSYKYYTGQALYQFSSGLSYTTFKLSRASPTVSPSAVEGLAVTLDGSHGNRESWPQVSVVVTNSGSRAGDEVVFLFHNASKAAARRHHHYQQQQQGEDAGSGAVPVVPLKQLVDFRRISMQPGESKTVSFQTSPASVATVDASGSRLVLPGEHGLLVSRGAQHVADELRLTIEVVAQEPRVLSQLPL
jgi:hypothetical protein